jgi:DNA polymerase III subunit delta'
MQTDTLFTAFDYEKLVGHEWAAELLQNSINSGKLGHAYVIAGPAGIGKSHLARHFVMALCCKNPPERAGLRFCGECRSCRMISEDKFPDVTVVGLDWQARNTDIGGSANANLKIDTVRAIQQEISRAPTEAARRIFIVEDADTMQPAAANAFLKTLEEPPPRAMLILVADSDKALLPTIASRCQVFDLRSVPTEQIREALIAGGATPDEAKKYAALSAGRPGYAMTALLDKTSLDDRDEAIMHLDNLLRGDRAERLGFAEELNGKWAAHGERRESVQTLLRVWLGWWRDLALVKNGQTAFVTNVDKLSELKAQAGRFSNDQIKDMLRAILLATSQLEGNISPRLALGDLFLNKLPRNR